MDHAASSAKSAAESDSGVEAQARRPVFMLVCHSRALRKGDRQATTVVPQHTASAEALWQPSYAELTNIT